jgi:REP element-mobilizing transposase RayT
MERKFNFSVDEYYHVYSRGVERREIFLDTGDKERFLRSLYIFNSDKRFQFRDTSEIPYGQLDRGKERTAIGAYCLMSNHFHLLVREITPGGISVFMGKLLTAYSMYFNKKYKRTGTLFESTFRARHVDNDNYLKYLFAYIHLNPVKIVESEWKQTGIADKKTAEEFLKNYKYSSYEEYMGAEREESAILSRDTFPEYFESGQSFNSFVKDWIDHEGFKE